MKRLLLAVNLLLASCVPQLSLAQRTPALKLTTADSIVAYGQPGIYFKWWQELASCENLDLPFPLIGRVQFYEVKAPLIQTVGESIPDIGVALPRAAQIFLATPYVLAEKWVKHEMLHQLLYWNELDFGPWHVAEFFDRCGLSPWGP
jgi:hypothetical protein